MKSHLVPSESPAVTVQSVSTTDVQLVISPPPSIEQNGPIIAYEIRIETFRFSIASELRNTTDIPTVYPLTLNVPFNASSLQEFVEYNISVRAYTSAGASEFSSIVQPTTLAAGLYTDRNMIDISTLILDESFEQLSILFSTQYSPTECNNTSIEFCFHKSYLHTSY